MAEIPPASGSRRDGVSAALPANLRLTETQRGILAALCRPCADGSRYATPATNQEIAAEVFLSVDAVKAHLRALYRKFGVEPLPHNQKRARLVEMVLEGNLLSAEQLAGDVANAEQLAEGDGGIGAPAHKVDEETTPGEAAELVPPHPDAGDRPPEHEDADRLLPASLESRGGPGRRSVLIGAASIVAIAAIALAASGVISGDSAGDSPEQLSPAAYRAAVNESCGLAIAGAAPRAGASSSERARSYLGVIETMNGRLESLGPPPGNDLALARFSSGLRRAADNTSIVALGPPEPGTRRSADVVAELTLAAGQVQAGALGYGLGKDCSAIGALVAASARNAAVYR